MAGGNAGIAASRSRTRRILRSIVGAAIVILCVTFFAYLLSYLSPTDPATRYFTDHGVVPSPEQLAEKRHELGLDRPFLEQYGSWLAAVFQAT